MRQANLEQQKVCLQILSDHMEGEGKKYQQLISQQVSSVFDEILLIGRLHVRRLSRFRKCD